jgi:DNA invertase Pin-like site-specific DNA recombinase
MPDFIAYYRVSTDRQGASGLGLEAQRGVRTGPYAIAGRGFPSRTNRALSKERGVKEYTGH